MHHDHGSGETTQPLTTQPLTTQPLRNQPLTTSECPAYILAGGRSSRFGSDKALVEVEGQVQLLRLESMLMACGHSTQIVADRADRYENLGRLCLVDQTHQAGPLAALATALQHRTHHAGTGWLLFIGCDQLLWKNIWWSQLAAKIEVGRQVISFGDMNAADASCLQPIPGLYHTSCLERVQARLSATDRSLRRLIESCDSVRVSIALNPRLWSFNSPEELELTLKRQWPEAE